MCGIVGIAAPAGGPGVDEAVLRRMTRTLTHRGPDDEAVTVQVPAQGRGGGAVGFGFTRLSIIDLEHGQQPMTNEDGSVVMVCNGEIFNYPELRSELVAAGHRFRSNVDVEVIVHLYEELGPAVVERLRGQFSFALYDRAQGRLLLARDHFGVTPLFYTQAGGALLFASEVKALLEHPAVERKVDLTGVDQVLSLPGTVSPRTCFAGIQSLPPGHLMVVQDGNQRLTQYWDIRYPEERFAEPPAPDQSRELEASLLRSVAGRLQADVPVGAYLSGGLDSSLIAAMMQQLAQGTRETFSISLADAFFDEGKYQQLMCDQLGFRHNRIDFGLDDIEANLQRVIRHCECPLKESYNAATLALSQAARERGVRVVLSGEGADELFAGYPSYRFDQFRRRKAQKGKSEPLSARETQIRTQLWGDPSFFYEKDLAQHELMRRALYSPRVRDSFGAFEFTQFGLVDPARVVGRHPVHQRSYLDLKVRLADHLVGDHGDRMLMANSVEGRFPFLDVDVAELAMRMSPDLKLNGYSEKYLLKQVAAKYVPEAIVTREKFGFVTQGTPHLLKRESGWALDLLSHERIRRQGYFDADEVERLKVRYMEPDFFLNLPIEEDLLMPVLTFSIFLDEFNLPAV